jgi:hypothetical protein
MRWAKIILIVLLISDAVLRLIDFGKSLNSEDDKIKHRELGGIFSTIVQAILFYFAGIFSL